MHNHRVNPKSSITENTHPEDLKNTATSKNLLVKYPWLWFVGLFVIPILVSFFGYHELIYIGHTPQKESVKSPELVSQNKITVSSNNNNPTPLWLMLAIASSCASGCLVIYRILKLPQRV
jgi:hypothetical protein